VVKEVEVQTRTDKRNKTFDEMHRISQKMHKEAFYGIPVCELTFWVFKCSTDLGRFFGN
jgi:hypothetical protein